MCMSSHGHSITFWTVLSINYISVLFVGVVSYARSVDKLSSIDVIVHSSSDRIIVSSSINSVKYPACHRRGTQQILAQSAG